MFNELNSVEHYIIDLLSETDLNKKIKKKNLDSANWTYIRSLDLDRKVNEVFMEVELEKL